jgi:hypothetical protein
MHDTARLLAFYLPQFHTIPENNEWWGQGFTEWTNTARAKPLYRGHYQPHVPADLGFYDLRVPETRQQQADLARDYGIEAFCYYHYWFAGRRILERPFQEVLASGKPDFPFCLCWANESWTGIWHGAPRRILIEQTYPGPDDHRAHFETLLPAFADARHVRVDGKPLFLIYKPEKLPDARQTMALWQDMAVKAGLPGLFMVGTTAIAGWNPLEHGFDARVDLPLVTARSWVSRRRPIAWLRQRYEEHRGLPTIHSYEKAIVERLAIPATDFDSYPCLVHAWDNTPRSGKNGVVMEGSTPALFRTLLTRAVEASRPKPPDRRLVFLKSWNEWAEGNHLEPDQKLGRAYLEAIREALVRG